MNAEPNYIISTRKNKNDVFLCLTHQRCVLAIAILEIIGAVLGLALFWYASLTYPLLKHYLPLPEDFLSDDIIIGILNTLLLLCVFELFLGFVLIDGTKNLRLGQVRFWLTSMFTYKVVECVLVVGMELGGCKTPELNIFLFFSLFLRSMEMLVVFMFMEKETLKRMRLKVSSIREIASNSSSFSEISVETEDTLERVFSEEPISNAREVP